ncbi:phage adaptor protein [Methylorubrum extorquens]
MADPIKDYPTLLAATEEYLARDDLQSYVPIFVQHAEGRFNTDLKVVDMHKSTGPKDLAEGRTDLPADFIDWVVVEWTPPANSPQRPLMLRYVEADSPEFRTRHRPNGPAQFYTVLAGKVRVMPSVSGKLEMTYYARIPPLTVAQPTNWLITKAPEVYLYATLMEAALFQKDEEKSAQWLGLVKERLGAIFGQADTQKTAARTARPAVASAEMTAAQAIS